MCIIKKPGIHESSYYFENGKYVGSIIVNSVITCDKLEIRQKVIQPKLFQ